MLFRATCGGFIINIFKLRGFPYLCVSCGVFRLFQHIFRENGVACRRVVNQNVGHRAYKLSVLQNGAAAHECVKYGTTIFLNFLKILYLCGFAGIFAKFEILSQRLKFMLYLGQPHPENGCKPFIYAGLMKFKCCPNYNTHLYIFCVVFGTTI